MWSSLLHRIPGTAAVVTAATYDVIAWNPLAERCSATCPPSPTWPAGVSCRREQ